MPYANFEWTVALSVIIGLIMSSAFSAILVYAQELLPMKVGLVSGIFFGFAFGIAGVSSAVLGKIADATDISVRLNNLCLVLPASGKSCILLPRVRTIQAREIGDKLR